MSEQRIIKQHYEVSGADIARIIEKMKPALQGESNLIAAVACAEFMWAITRDASPNIEQALHNAAAIIATVSQADVPPEVSRKLNEEASREILRDFPGLPQANLI